jgi:hypothetical protein
MLPIELANQRDEDFKLSKKAKEFYSKIFFFKISG